MGDRSKGYNTKPAIIKIANSIAINERGCWVWTKSLGRDGYAKVMVKHRRHIAHRLSYETFNGPIPEGLVIDHLCRNRACVNPEHLRATTQRENVLCGEGRAAVNARKTHCPSGHPYSGDNLRVRPGMYGRVCKACHRINRKRDRDAKREVSL